MKNKIKGCALCKDLIKLGYDSPKGKKYQSCRSEYGLKIIDERGLSGVNSFILKILNENECGVWYPIKFCPNCGRDLSIQSGPDVIIHEIFKLIRPLQDLPPNEFYAHYIYRDEEGNEFFLNEKIQPLLDKLKNYADDKSPVYDTEVMSELFNTNKDDDFQICVKELIKILDYMKEYNICMKDIIMFEIILSYFNNAYD